MKWLEIPIEELKQFDKDWETRRTSNDGTKALLHEETYNSARASNHDAFGR